MSARGEGTGAGGVGVGAAAGGRRGRSGASSDTSKLGGSCGFQQLKMSDRRSQSFGVQQLTEGSLGTLINPVRYLRFPHS
jgi:hypothetical protein